MRVCYGVCGGVFFCFGVFFFGVFWGLFFVGSGFFLDEDKLGDFDGEWWWMVVNVGEWWWMVVNVGECW